MIIAKPSTYLLPLLHLILQLVVLSSCVYAVAKEQDKENSDLSKTKRTPEICDANNANEISQRNCITSSSSSSSSSSISGSSGSSSSSSDGDQQQVIMRKRQWAIKLQNSDNTPPTEKDADEFATVNGFLNIGQIGDLEGYFLFEAPTLVGKTRSDDDSSSSSSSSSQSQHQQEDNENNTNNDHDAIIIDTEWNGHPISSLKKRSVQDIEDEFLEMQMVNWFEIQVGKKRVKRSIIPKVERRQSSGDMEGATYFTDPLYRKQWHLFNNGDNGNNRGNDINVLPVWKKGINGTGVTISVIDDGVDFNHPDLKDTWSKESSYDFTRRIPDPTPQNPSDTHGTRCAGEIAALPNNDYCGVGVAFGAKLSAERLISSSSTLDATEASAFNFKNQVNLIYSASWGPNDDGMSVDGPGTLGQLALQQGVTSGRDGLGSIFVFASGNGGLEHDNCNYDGYANSIYTISIGAITHSGSLPYYGEECSAHLAVTYSGGEGLGIVTSDVSEDCTNKHSGTSAAAPIAAGIIGLLLSVRPDLSWRDVQQLIVETARPEGVDYHGDEWTENGAGKLVSHKYGFGSMNADDLITRGKDYVTLPQKSLLFSKEQYTNKYIQHVGGDNSGGGGGFIDEMVVEQSEIDETGLVSLEHVQVMIRLTHQERGHLDISLVSPSGTRSLIGASRPQDESPNGYNPWTFMTVHNWGEKPVGRWRLEIYDARYGSINPETGEKFDAGFLLGWKVILHGTCSSDDIVEVSVNTTKLATTPTKQKLCMHTIRATEKRKQNLLVGVVVVSIAVVIGVTAYVVKKVSRTKAGDDFRYRQAAPDDLESPSYTKFQERIALQELEALSPTKRRFDPSFYETPPTPSTPQINYYNNNYSNNNNDNNNNNGDDDDSGSEYNSDEELISNNNNTNNKNTSSKSPRAQMLQNPFRRSQSVTNFIDEDTQATQVLTLKNITTSGSSLKRINSIQKLDIVNSNYSNNNNNNNPKKPPPPSSSSSLNELNNGGGMISNGLSSLAGVLSRSGSMKNLADKTKLK